MTAYEILMGACGWDYPQWQDEFYPEDLPPEWRLAYYANEFPVVLIPQSYWSAEPQTISQWSEETDERPLFIAEMPTPDVLESQGCSAAQWFEKLSPLRERLLGVCCQAVSEAALNAALDVIPVQVPVCVQRGAGATDPQYRPKGAAAQRELGCCWNGSGNADCMHHGPLAIARVDSQQMHPRELREVVESCRRAAHANRVVVLLADGDPPRLETLRNAELIAQLI